MNGKQLFCLSLIILSVVMGLHWFKNRPKERKKPKDRPRVALNLDDLQIQDGENPEDIPEDNPEDNPPPDENDPENPENPEDGEPPPDDAVPGDEASASGTTDLAAIASAGSELPPELNDPIIIALRTMQRNPFEVSPYAQLVERLRELENKPEEVEIIKTTKLLQANFTATIRTRKELVAVIDSRLYRKGDSFQDRKITEIDPEMVKIDTPSSLFIIPKVGVEVNIATDGTYTFEDSYRKN